MIETLEDIVEELADLLGVYGAHSRECIPPHNCCRVCWASHLTERITASLQGSAYDSALDKRTIAHLMDQINELKELMSSKGSAPLVVRVGKL